MLVVGWLAFEFGGGVGRSSLCYYFFFNRWFDVNWQLLGLLKRTNPGKAKGSKGNINRGKTKEILFKLPRINGEFKVLEKQVFIKISNT